MALVFYPPPLTAKKTTGTSSAAISNSDEGEGSVVPSTGFRLLGHTVLPGSEVFRPQLLALTPCDSERVTRVHVCLNSRGFSVLCRALPPQLLVGPPIYLQVSLFRRPSKRPSRALFARRGDRGGPAGLQAYQPPSAAAGDGPLSSDSEVATDCSDAEGDAAGSEGTGSTGRLAPKTSCVLLATLPAPSFCESVRGKHSQLHPAGPALPEVQSAPAPPFDTRSSSSLVLSGLVDPFRRPSGGERREVGEIRRDALHIYTCISTHAGRPRMCPSTCWRRRGMAQRYRSDAHIYMQHNLQRE